MPPGVGVAIHYLAIVGLFALFVWLVVPRALGQVEDALGVSALPTSAGDLSQAANNSTGVKHEILVGLQKRLAASPVGIEPRPPGLEFGAEGVRDPDRHLLRLRERRVLDLRARPGDRLRLLARCPGRNGSSIRDTWTLIDLKLGAFVRGQLLLVALVAVVLSLAFWAIGEPYWILVGAFAGSSRSSP